MIRSQVVSRDTLPFTSGVNMHLLWPLEIEFYWGEGLWFHDHLHHLLCQCVTACWCQAYGRCFVHIFVWAFPNFLIAWMFSLQAWTSCNSRQLLCCPLSRVHQDACIYMKIIYTVQRTRWCFSTSWKVVREIHRLHMEQSTYDWISWDVFLKAKKCSCCSFPYNWSVW